MRNRITEIRQVKGADLRPNPKNWRLHPERQKAALESVLAQVGIADVLLAYQTADGLTLIDGHCRADLHPDTEWTVAVLDVDEAEANTILATLDPLAAMAETDQATLDALRAVMDAHIQEAFAPPLPPAQVDAEPQFDRIGELRTKWGVEPGQLWALGDHRLLCGDSGKPDDVARLMAGEKHETVIFDPEWDAMPGKIEGESILAFCDGFTIGKIVNLYGPPTWIFVWDCIASWYTPHRPLRRAKLCAWYGNITKYNFEGGHYGDPGKEHLASNSRGSYNYTPCEKGKHLSDVFSLSLPKFHSNELHNHSKPVDWLRCLIGNCTTGLVYEPFSGSGTSIMACEQLGRACRAIEIDPSYCAVALERFHEATGKMPSPIDMIRQRM